MSKVKGQLLGMLAMAMAMDGHSMTHEDKSSNNEVIHKPIPKKVIPKGCKEYFFTLSGRFDLASEKWNDIDYVFDCVAMNEKSAVRKFNKWKQKQ